MRRSREVSREIITKATLRIPIRTASEVERKAHGMKPMKIESREKKKKGCIERILIAWNKDEEWTVRIESRLMPQRLPKCSFSHMELLCSGTSQNTRRRIF